MSEGNRVDISVDRELCVGHGICESIAPDLFEVGVDGTVGILLDRIPPELTDAARAAVAECPSRALRLSDSANQ
ncbi:ferredoxin [Nocardia sp. NPDC048505]|uniref:ferredoxin n=1 Tax=unclassified Nocardia TaxID=2637762 RepID=UPI003406D56A